MKYKLGILIILILFLTGCHSYTELNDLSIVNTIGIDYQNEKYQLVINVIDGKLDDKEMEKKITTFSSEETTLEEAFQDIYLKSSKKLYLSHLDLLILTENAIEEKFLEITHNVLKNNEYRNNFPVVLLKDSGINDFMKNHIEAEDINHLIKTNQRETGFSESKDFETLLKELLIDKSSYLPTISYKNQEFSLRGFTLIRDYKIYEELTLKESILLNLLQNKIQKSYLNGSNILENQTLITTKQNKISIHFITTVDEEDSFVETTKKDLIELLNRFHNDNYDILKLKEKVRKNDYSYYQNTNSLLQKLTFDLTFETKKRKTYLQGDASYEAK